MFACSLFVLVTQLQYSKTSEKKLATYAKIDKGFHYSLYRLCIQKMCISFLTFVKLNLFLRNSVVYSFHQYNVKYLYEENNTGYDREAATS